MRSVWMALGLLCFGAPATGQVVSSSVAPAAQDAGVAPAPALEDAGLAQRPPPRKVRVQQRRAKQRRAKPRRARAPVDAGTVDASPAPRAAPAPVAPPLSPPPAAPVEAVPGFVGPPSVQAVQASPLTRILLWLLVIAALLMAGRTADVLAEHMHTRGSLPMVLRLAATGTRVLAGGLVLLMLSQVAPQLMAHGPVVLAVLAAVLLFAGRDLLRDVLAHFVLRFEGRVQLGQHLEAGAVKGQVARVGLRATRVVDAAGRAADIPNHLLLEAPIFAESEGWPTREVVLRLPDGNGEALRHTIVDAARASPWVPIDAEVSTRRDAKDPSLWILHTQLLDASFTERFAGEISEQVEARLRKSAPSGLSSAQ